MTVLTEEDRLIMRCFAYINLIIHDIPREQRQEGYEILNRCQIYFDLADYKKNVEVSK